MIGPAGSQLYEFIVTNMPDGLIWADREGIIRIWNQSAERFLGYRADEAIGQSLDLVLPEPCRGRHWAAFHRWMATGENRIEEPFGVISLIHRDGTTVRLESTFVRTRDERGETVGAGALVRPEGMSTG